MFHGKDDHSSPAKAESAGLSIAPYLMGGENKWGKPAMEESPPKTVSDLVGAMKWADHKADLMLPSKKADHNEVMI